MSQTLNDIADRLVASGLLSGGQLADLLAEVPHARHEPPEQFVQTLVRRGTLTNYQAECVLAGRIEQLVLGNYVVIDKLGQGGMGLVLKARHRRMDRVVALKVLSPEGVRTPEMAERFQREVRAAAKLSHCNIVASHDADEAHGTHFLVMEYVDGRDLASLIKQQGPLSLQLSIECILQAAYGLEYAHQQGIVHRDIKPGNLIVCQQAVRRSDDSAASGVTLNLKILDMGLAHIASLPGGAAERELTTTGSVMGTIDFMSPEQALDAKLADARSDIYSLGCSLYYLLTAKAPYEGDTAMRRLLAHRDAPIPELMKLRSDAPPELQAVLQTMIAKDPGDRFQTMTELIRALASLQAKLGLASTTELLLSASSPLSTNRRPDGTFADTLIGTSIISGAPPLPLTSKLPEKFPAVGRGTGSKKVVAGLATAGVLLIGAGCWLSQGRAPPDRAVNQRHSGEVKSIPQPVSSAKRKTSKTVNMTTDRQVVEWILQHGGSVWLNDQNAEFKAVADLPAGNFKTTMVVLYDRQRWNDADLTNLLGLKNLKQLTIYDSRQVTDAGIAHLKGLTSINRLQLFDTRMTDSGIQHLAAMSHLQYLMLVGPQFTDSGVRHFQAADNLQGLTLNLPQMTDDGLGHLRGLSRLQGLDVSRTRVTDAGLVHFAHMTSLDGIGLSSTRVSDVGLKHLGGLTNLASLYLNETQVTDAGLSHLRGLYRLGVLSLEKTAVTKEGVARLQAVLPKCTISFSAK